MGVGTAADDPDPVLGERGGEGSRVRDDAVAIVPELRSKRLAEADRLGGEYVCVKAPLDAGEHRGLEAFGELVRARENQPAPRPAQGLGGGAGDDVGVRQGRGVRAGGDETRDMGHVDQEPRLDG